MQLYSEVYGNIGSNDRYGRLRTLTDTPGNLDNKLVAVRHSTVFGGCTAIPVATALWQITYITDTLGNGQLRTILAAARHATIFAAARHAQQSSRQ